MNPRFMSAVSELLANSEVPVSPLGALSGIPIVGIVEHIAGPVALGALVADGAIGISVEPLSGDPARHYLSHECFSTFHAGKMSVAMDLKTDPNYAKILRAASIIIDNRSKRARDKDAVLQAFLLDANKSERVIYCYISGFSGHDEHRAGNDVTVQAATGLAYVNAPTKDQPLKIGTPLLDFSAADWAVMAIQSRIIQMQRGIPINDEKNKVIPIQINLAAIAARLMCSQYLAVNKGEAIKPRFWNQDNYVSVFSFFKASDDVYLSIATLTDASFKIFCERVIMRPDLSEKYPKNALRLEHNDYIHKEIQACIAKTTSFFWSEKLKSGNITYSIVETVASALQQSYSSHLFTKTKDGTPIIARPDGATPSLNPAPKLNQHGAVLSRWLDHLENKQKSQRLAEENKTRATIPLNYSGQGFKSNL